MPSEMVLVISILEGVFIQLKFELAESYIFSSNFLSKSLIIIQLIIT